MSPIAVIYFDDPAARGYPFTEPLYRESYRDFTAYCAERGLEILIARGHSYLGSMRFERGWRFSGDELRDVPGPIDADLIYLKGRADALGAGPDDRVVNRPEFERIARNKWETYQRFPQFSPLTFVINAQNWREVAAQIPTDRIILKPIVGYGGEGIQIVQKSTFDWASLDIKAPYIAQEFVDSSGGIPGVCKGLHDLRIILFDGVPKLSFVRQPKAGSLLSNVAQGGSAFALDLARVPTPVLDVARQIDESYTRFNPRIYATDFFLQIGRPYLVETNPQPGFPHPKTEGTEFTQQFYNSLFELLNGAMRK